MILPADPIAFTLTRTFDAARAVVWKAWSEAEQIQQWWGPQGCTIDLKCFEFRPGGFFHYAMAFGGETAMWGRFNYRDITAPERIVWLNSFSNECGGMARAPFSEDCPLEVLNTVSFSEPAPGQTTLSLRAEPFGATDAERSFFEVLHPSLEQGYGGTFDQLAAFLRRG